MWADCYNNISLGGIKMRKEISIRELLSAGHKAFEIDYHGMTFASMPDEDGGILFWATICQKCADKLKSNHKLEKLTFPEVCKVKGCNNVANFYIDFIDEDCKFYIEEINELTEEEVKEYMVRNGSPDNDGKWLLEHKRPKQAIEAVKNDYDLLDFDEWQALQNVLFGDSGGEISFKTALKINSALWDEDISPLDLDIE